MTVIDKITQSNIRPLEQVDKINEIIDYKQDVLTAGNNILITAGAKHTTLTAVSSNPDSVITNNYNQTKSSLGTEVETYTARNIYGYKIEDWNISSSDYYPTFNKTTGIASDLYTLGKGYNIWFALGDYGSGNVYSVVCHYIVGSNKTTAQNLAITIDTTLKLSEIPNYSSLVTGADLYIKVEQISANKIRYSYSLNGSSFTTIKTNTGGSGHEQNWVVLGSTDEQHGFLGTIDCKTSYVYDANGSIITPFAITDDTVITGLEWTLNGLVSSLPSGVSVTNAVTGDILTCTYVTENVTLINTIDLVSKSGDTMTGALNINVDTQNQLVLINPYITKGTNPSEKKYYGLYFNDSQNLSADDWKDTRIGGIETSIGTNGTVSLDIQAVQNVADGTAKQSLLRLDVTSAGEASCAFPDTECCDGQWVAKFLSVFSGVTAIGSDDYSISSYLPNDGHAYEVLACMQMNDDGATSGTDSVAAVGNVANPVDNNCFRIYGNSDKGIWKPRFNGVLVFLGNQRKVYYQIKARALQTGLALWFFGYRRIGTNS